MNHRLLWLGLIGLFGAFLIAACSQQAPAPEPPPQPVSVIVVTATFTPTPTPTPTITSTPTALPREKFEAIEGLEGWYWLYGRTSNFVVAQTDFDYRARFLASEWEVMAGPALLHRVLPKCSFNIFDWPRELPYGTKWPPAGRRPLVVPADMLSTMSGGYVAPFSEYSGDEQSADFESQATNCQAAGQRVLDTLMLAPPSPGYMPTATPLPFVYLRPDDRDPAWSIFSSLLSADGTRANVYVRADEWQINPNATGYLLHTQMQNCSIGIVEDKGTGWGSNARLLVPQAAPPSSTGEERLALLVMYWGGTENEQTQCIVAAQRVADTLFYAQPLNR